MAAFLSGGRAGENQQEYECGARENGGSPSSFHHDAVGRLDLDPGGATTGCTLNDMHAPIVA